MMRATYFLMGFLTDAVLLRLSGILPNDDIFFPATLLLLLVILDFSLMIKRVLQITSDLAMFQVVYETTLLI